MIRNHVLETCNIPGKTHKTAIDLYFFWLYFNFYFYSRYCRIKTLTYKFNSLRMNF